MDFFSDLFNNIINPSYMEKRGADANAVGANAVGANVVGANAVGANASIPRLVGPNESCIKRKFNPNVLDQGKTLHREQLQRSEALRPNIRGMNEDIIEGFGEMTANKNSAQTTDTTTYSDNFDKNIDRYTKEYPMFIDETRNAVKLNNRNIKKNPLLFKNEVNTMYDFTFEKEGCYKSAGASGLELQTDMNDVTVETCNKRTYDLGYSGFAIGKSSSGKLDCYLSKDISQAKVGGISTKPMVSMAFKKSGTASVGALLGNGQLGIYDSSKVTDNDLVTDLNPIEGCELTGADITINEGSVAATFGGNCRPNLNTISSDFNNKCIDQNNGSKDAWLQMQMRDCQPYNPSQNMTYDSNSKTIYAPGNNLCFDVRGFGTEDGTAVIQYPCSGGANQKWTYKSDKTLRPASAPEKCLDVWMGNNENGAGLVIATCHGKSNQTWNIKSNGNIIIPPEPRLKLTNSSAWEALGTDKNTGGDPDASFWSVKTNTVGKDTYYPLGNTIFAGGAGNVYYNTPNTATMTVAGDVRDPVGYTPITGSRGRYSIAVNRPICPEGYFSMGDVITSNIAPTPKDIKCIPSECVTTDNRQGNRIWSGLGIEARTATYNLFKANRGDSSLYTIKESCLK